MNFDDILAKEREKQNAYKTPEPSAIAATPPHVAAANKIPVDGKEECITKYIIQNDIAPSVQPELKFLLQMLIEPILFNP